MNELQITFQIYSRWKSRAGPQREAEITSLFHFPLTNHAPHDLYLSSVKLVMRVNRHDIFSLDLPVAVYSHVAEVLIVGTTTPRPST